MSLKTPQSVSKWACAYLFLPRASLAFKGRTLNDSIHKNRITAAHGIPWTLSQEKALEPPPLDSGARAARPATPHETAVRMFAAAILSGQWGPRSY